MAKFTKASEDIAKIVDEVAAELGYDNFLDFETLSVPKAKDVVTVSKASSVVEFFSKRDDLILVFVYEKAFDMVEDKDKYMWVRLALEQIVYDTEKDKVSIGIPSITVPVGCYEKWKNVAVDSALLAQYTISQIKDQEAEEKARKAAEKAAKKKKKTEE